MSSMTHKGDPTLSNYFTVYCMMYMYQIFIYSNTFSILMLFNILYQDPKISLHVSYVYTNEIDTVLF